MGLGPAPDLLEVDQFRDARMAKDVVTAAGAQEFEPKALHQIEEIGKKDILQISLCQALE